MTKINLRAKNTINNIRHKTSSRARSYGIPAFTEVR